MLAEPTTLSRQELFQQFLAEEIKANPGWEMVLKDAALDEQKTLDTGTFHIMVHQIYTVMCNKLVAPALLQKHKMACHFVPLPDNPFSPAVEQEPKLEDAWWDALKIFLDSSPTNRLTFRDARFLPTSTKANIVVELSDSALSHANRVLHSIRVNLPRYNGALPNITFVDQAYGRELEQKQEAQWENINPYQLAQEVAASRPKSPPPPPPVTTSAPPPPPPPAVDTSGQVQVGLVSLDPTRGYIPLPHYGIRFWQPLIGLQAFSLWQVLRSYGHFVKQGKMEWPTIELLVDTLGQGSRHTILGRNASGNRPEQVGLVDELIKARLVRHWVTGEGRAVTHNFDVLDELPLLAPAQVRLLPPRKQQEHQTFLQYFKAFSYESWACISAATCIPEWWI